MQATRGFSVASVSLWFILFSATGSGAAEPCRVEVVEQGSGWPVPLVIMETTGHLRFVSDNAGVIAIDEPDLLGREVFFHVSSPNYEVRADGFGIRGVRLVPRAGETLRVEVTRTLPAKRLGRLTGAGLFTESQRSTPAGSSDEGRDAEDSATERRATGQGRATSRGAFPRETGVVGCDSIQLATHRGRRFWMWGDTTLHHYPLGVFDMTAATTPIRPLESFEPPLSVKFDYFRAEDGPRRGQPRGVADMPGSGPTWLGGFVSLPDGTGAPRLVATYAKIKPPLEEYERGLCVWNEDAEKFEHLRTVWTKSDDSPKPPPTPKGHPVLWTDDAGTEWVLFGDPLPRLRCPATFEAWQDASTWEELERQGTLKSADGDRDVTPHSGSIAWHPWRKRWVTVFMEKFGKPSAFGELWYAESDAPTGPWGPAVKILSHANYTFYNPRIHEEWFDAESPVLCIEGTYTATFADRPEPTPRWDYNQVLYRLDLDDPTLAPGTRSTRTNSE